MKGLKIFSIFYVSLFFSVRVIAQRHSAEYARDISLTDVQGIVKKLSEQKGKVVLLDFGLPGAAHAAKQTRAWLNYIQNTSKRALKFLV